jgi:hypothetical protein
LPPVGALDQLRGQEGILERARSNPRIVVAIAAGVVLLLAWIGWAIYVTSSNGAAAGLGVVIAWPAMLAALALISLPFIGGYLLIRRLSESDGSSSTAEADEDEEPEESADEESAEEEGEDADDDEDAEEEEEEEEEEDGGGEEDEPEEEDEDEDDGDDASDEDSDDPESDPKAKAAKK